MGHSPASTPGGSPRTLFVSYQVEPLDSLSGSDWDISDFNPLLVENHDKSLTVFLHSGITGELVAKYILPNERW